MSILVVQIPPRSRARLATASGPEAVALQTPSEFSYVLSTDGLIVSHEGRTKPALMPKADSVIAVLPDCDVSWHRITVPKAPAARLRAALNGVLEEALLDELELTHLALAPGASAGEPAWVAAVHRDWLRLNLAALEKSGLTVERVVPSAWPDDVPLGHFADGGDEPGDGASQTTLVWSDGDGVACLGLQGTLARALQPAMLEQPARWSATPAVAAPAERWLGAPVMVLTTEQRALQATRSLWNLRQFDLAARHKGARAVREAWQRFLRPQWRPVRWGLIGLVLLHIVGLNLWAAHQRDAIGNKQLAMAELLRSSFPKLRVVYEAPLQMERETALLRAAAGRAGDDDLESLLRAAAAAWPPGRPPVDTLRFEPGRLSLAANGWTEQQTQQFRSQLQPAGWTVEADAGRLTLSRARPAGAAF
jgi:general secretion pathway protein L